MAEPDLIREMIERRRKVRSPQHNRRGVIKFGPSGQDLPCTILDITPEGAGLSVGSTFGLPEVFRLTIDNERGTRHCKLMWVDGKKLGVSFE